MVPTWTARLEVERRLLAALFLWPRLIELDPRAFLSPQLGALYAAWQAVGEHYWHAANGGVRLLRSQLDLDGFGAMFRSDGQLVQFLNELPLESVTEHAIVDLVELVRECPRCGK